MAVTVSKADTFTNLKKKQIYYSDFTDNFDQTPFGQCLATITNEESVNQSLRNLIFTNYGDRPFQPTVGCNVSGSLFELSGVVLVNLLQDSITATIAMNEPRAILESIVVQDPNNINNPTTPASSDKNSIEITIQYYLVNNPRPINLTVFLRRIR